MKEYKTLLAVALAAAACGLCALNASAEENTADEQSNPIIQVTEAVVTDNLTETSITPATTVSEIDITKAVIDETADNNMTKFGWEEDSNGKRYYIADDGEKLTGYQKIDGKEYYFSANGILKSGFYTINNIRMYFSDETFERQLGWISYNNAWFYLDENGKSTGRKTIDSKDYIFDEHGACYSDWFVYDGNKYYSDHDNGLYKNKCDINGETYYFSSKGRFKSGWITSEGIRIFYDYDTARPLYGWIKFNGNIYYSGETEGKYTGDKIIDGIKYRFADNGRQQIGMQKFSDGFRFYDESGKIKSGFVTMKGKKYYFSDNTYLMQTGMQNIGGKKYYFDNEGIMETGWQTIKDKKYFFGSDGVMKTGLQKIDGKKYYFNKNGIMQTSWQTISGKKYYFNEKGVMQTNWQTIDSKKYYFGNDGVMRTGNQVIDGKKYYFDKDGVLDAGSWSTLNGSRYYYSTDGKMYKNGVFKIKDNYYYFSKNGIMQTGWQKIGNSYYLFDRGDGHRESNKTVDGVKINKDGKANITDWSRLKIETMMTAHKIMLAQTNASDSMETKRLKCFNWVLSLPYHRYRFLNSIYTQAGWEMTFANDIFKQNRGCCVSESSALAFLFREIGYTEVAVCHDSSHAWTTIGKYIYDPLFAESKDFNNNYNVLPYDYRINPLDKRAID